jgi:hypothetical protein
MPVDLKTITICDDKSLLSACDTLHDASFDLSSLSHDKDCQTCSMTFERELSDYPDLIQTQPKLFFFEKISYPLVKSTLILNNIRSIDIIDKSHIGTYTFLGGFSQDGIYTFQFAEDFLINITHEGKPKGSLVDNEFLNKFSRIHTFGLRKLFNRPCNPV